MTEMNSEPLQERINRKPRIESRTGDIMATECDVAIVNLFEGVTQPAGATGAADRHLNGLITRIIDEGEASGKLGNTTLIHAHKDSPSKSPKRILIVGLGPQSSFDIPAIRTASAAAIHRVKSFAKTVATVVHGAGIAGKDSRASATALTEGTLLGTYSFDKYKTSTENEASHLDSVTIVEFDDDKLPDISEGIADGIRSATAQNLARDLVNEPANQLTPSAMLAVAEEVAATHQLKLQVFDQNECASKGMGAFCGVARGSREPAMFVHLTHEGAPTNPEKNVWLIGKSITFDSGGLSLKSPTGMLRMKGDMGGGAAVLGAMLAIGDLAPDINVHAVLPITENMPGGDAQRPGDVVKSMSGTFIEIVNTDAEGRLTLADAIDYAKSQGAQQIIDIATLTGAARVALGTGNSALFTNRQHLADLVLAAANSAGDDMWQLPLDPASKRLNRSDIADLKNSGGLPAGSITAAHFISHFAGETPWIHIDIAATSMTEAGTGPFKSAGATGVPTRTLIETVTRLADHS